MDIPLCIPDLGDDEIEAVADVLRSGWLAHGPKNEEFEEAFAEYVGVGHAITLNSCTSALHLAIKAQGITGEVIVPSFTWVASANAIVTGGAEPVFVDVRPETRNIDPEAVEAAITEDTEAIMPVHYGGLSCEMGPLADLAEDHNLAIVEDSAETIGGEYGGQRTGSFGVGCFSMYPTKNITTGEGGVLTTDDDELAARVRELLGHGIASTTLDREGADNSWYRAATTAGYNFRMSNVHAAIGVEQMARLDEMNDRRRRHAAALTDALEDVSGIDPPTEPADRKHVYQMYTVMTGADLDRNAFVEELNDRSVGASVHFSPPVHRQPRYEGRRYARNDLSVTEEIADNIVTLPMYPQLTDEELDYLIGTVAETAEALAR